MGVIAGHPYVALLIAVVAFYVVSGIVEAVRARSSARSVCGGATLSLGRAGRNGARNRAGKAMRIAL